jgi:hypothetical protein
LNAVPGGPARALLHDPVHAQARKAITRAARFDAVAAEHMLAW